MGVSLSKAVLARKLGVSRSSLYYQAKLPDKDELLRLQIEQVMEAHPSYGHRRVADALRISKKRALRVMKKFNLKPARRCRAPRKQLDENTEPTKYPDITKCWSPVVPDMLWTGDFTFIPFQGQYIYLAVVQDRYTAFIHGARVMTNHHRELVLGAMTDALKRATCAPEWFHSDQGSEYTSTEFSDLLLANKIKFSNSPKSSPWRNGAQESFFGRFKIEFGNPACYDSLPELMQAIYRYIHYYNFDRIHTRLRTTPAEFRQNGKILNSRKTYPHQPSSYQQPPPTSMDPGPFSEVIDNCYPTTKSGHA